MNMQQSLQQSDPKIAASIDRELERLEYHLELIASENYVSPAVLEALGSALTIKYAEGYPGKRYYGGCEFVDEAETLACERAKELFGAEHANVQPHSGASANLGVYYAVCQPGDTVLGMDLAQGGHLTHGCPVNFSGKWFNNVSYGINPETERLDYDQIASLAKEHKPKMIIAGASAYARDIDFAAFRSIADDVGAVLLADIAHPAGLIAAKLHSQPFPHAHIVTTTTHKTLRGPRGGMILCQEEYAKAIDKSIFPGLQGGPLMHVIAAKAVAFGEALSDDFTAYGKRVIENAQAMASTLMDRGYRIVTGGTDNHMFLIDLSGREVTGKDAEAALGRAAITSNKNTVPNEQRSPFVTSGIRIGTPAVTTRGMGVEQMQQIGNWVADIIDDAGNEALQLTIQQSVRELCEQFPVYAK